jgi:hypothetical protein
MSDTAQAQLDEINTDDIIGEPKKIPKRPQSTIRPSRMIEWLGEHGKDEDYRLEAKNPFPQVRTFCYDYLKQDHEANAEFLKECTGLEKNMALQIDLFSYFSGFGVGIDELIKG